MLVTERWHRGVSLGVSLHVSNPSIVTQLRSGGGVSGSLTPSVPITGIETLTPKSMSAGTRSTRSTWIGRSCGLDHSPRAAPFMGSSRLPERFSNSVRRGSSLGSA
jgi:hypothetical protein